MSVNESLSDRAAEEVRALLARQRISGSELARRLEVSHTWVTNRLAGHREISLNDLEKIAKALGVDVSALLPQPVRGNMLPSSLIPARATTTRLLAAGCAGKVTPHTPNSHDHSQDYPQRRGEPDDRRPVTGRSRRPIWRHDRVTA